MKLSTKVKRFIPYQGRQNVLARPVRFFLDCDFVKETCDLDEVDKVHNRLTKEEGCTLLTCESFVVSPYGITIHYTSTNYENWCNL